ncbi:hypothetical protein TRVL_09185 [Trypanosoma vivax]|nr:hypothetical protein TRVL_09185 [Trypanosoma vivax]
MVLSMWSVVVGEAALRRIWDLILRVARPHASVNFQFAFSHRGERDKAGDKGVGYGIGKAQSTPGLITDTVTGVERQGRNEMQRVFEGGRMPRTQRSALLDRVRPAPKQPEADHLGESFPVKFGTGAAEHFG